MYPVLTPLAVDPCHPFPYISNLSLNLVVEVGDPVTGERRIARVKVPPVLPRFVVMPDGERFVPLEQVIAAHLDTLFPGMTIGRHDVFRVTRNADLTFEEDTDDLLMAIEMELRQRRFGRAVRLEIATGAADSVRDLLASELQVSADNVYSIEAPIDLGGLWAVFALDRPDLHEESWTPMTPPPLASAAGEPVDIFAVLRERDVLVHHPYDSFATSVEAFVAQAADDPDVLGIKQTLYRTSGDSPIVASLIRAAELGKQVAALVELRARFDEQANIGWAKALEEAGVHVVYGLVGPEDPLEDLPRAAPRGRRDPPLLPHRHRQLQLEDGPHLRGPRPAHRRRGHRDRPRRPVQLPDRVQPPRRLPPDPGVAGDDPGPDHRADRGAGGRRPGRPHRAQAQRAHRPGGDRRPLRRLDGRRPHRPRGPGPVLAPAGHPGALRDDPGALDRRASSSSTPGSSGSVASPTASRWSWPADEPAERRLGTTGVRAPARWRTDRRCGSTSARRTSCSATSTAASRSSPRCATAGWWPACSRSSTWPSPTTPTPGSSTPTATGAGCPTVRSLSLQEQLKELALGRARRRRDIEMRSQPPV